MKKTFMALALTLLPFGMASAQVRMLVVPKRISDDESEEYKAKHHQA